jgi:hypothetical protein
MEKVTEADKIWEEIQNKELPMFALPDQKIKDHVERLSIPGEGLYVKLSSTSVLVGLEAVLGDKFEFVLAEKYLIIKRKPPELKIEK